MVFIITVAWPVYPTEGHKFLEDRSVAQMLGLKLSSDGPILLAGYATPGA
jgi:hypothetical protein